MAIFIATGDRTQSCTFNNKLKSAWSIKCAVIGNYILGSRTDSCNCFVKNVRQYPQICYVLDCGSEYMKYQSLYVWTVGERFNTWNERPSQL